MNELRQLSDSEIDAVAGGLNQLGQLAQTSGGRVLGQDMQNVIANLGGQAAAQSVIVPAAHSSV